MQFIFTICLVFALAGVQANQPWEFHKRDTSYMEHLVNKARKDANVSPVKYSKSLQDQMQEYTDKCDLDMKEAPEGACTALRGIADPTWVVNRWSAEKDECILKKSSTQFGCGATRCGQRNAQLITVCMFK